MGRHSLLAQTIVQRDPLIEKMVGEEHIQLPYSKDNYFFAVQSVSEAGNESLPVVPGVER